ncbi:MAG: type II toxin-antitoxin system Phd/YefM family antitoxin [Propionibacteriaceae bacterium]|jgi:prevent-host-death family protein|nr:type II toxin-antitoxin system Phd/YefM family antitoxin [Propionibacteriaceae bacterium]
MSTVHVAEAKAKLSQYVLSVQRTHERVTITRNGVPAAVMVSPEDLESLEETLAIMSDRGLMAEIAEAKSELDAGLGEALRELPERR